MFMNRRKSIALVLSAAMLLSALPAPTVRAVSEAELKLSAPAYVSAGSTFNLSMEISENAGFSAAGFSIQLGSDMTPRFDQQAPSFTLGSGFESLQAVADYNASLGMLAFAGASTENISENGNIVTFPITVSPSAQNGEYRISLSVIQFHNTAMHEVAYHISPLTLQIGEEPITTTIPTTTTTTTTTTVTTTTTTTPTTTTVTTTTTTCIPYAKLQIVRPPDKTVYFMGETLDLSGGIADGEGHDEYGEAFENAGAMLSELEIDASAFDAAKAGAYPIKVSWMGASTTFDVTVIETPRLYLTADGGYPSGQATLHLCMQHNPTLADFTITISLPDILKPVMVNNQPQMTPTAALAGNITLFYLNDRNTIGIGYHGNDNAAATTEIATFLVNVDESAKIGENAEISLSASTMKFKGIPNAIFDTQEKAAFTVTAPSPRTLSDLTVSLSKPEETHALSLSPQPDENTICTWKSDAPEVASVDENGVITAHSNGSANITVLCEGVTYSCAVTVRILRSLSESTLLLSKYQETTQLTLSPAPAADACTWSSSAPQIASVSADGTITALNNGIAKVSCVCEGITYTCEVTVAFPRTLSPSEYDATTQGETFSLTLTPAPTTAEIQYRSNHPDVVSVDANGKVTCLTNGKAVITVVCENISYSCHVTVSIPRKLNYTEYSTQKLGDTFKLALSSNVPHDKIQFTSDHPEIASVSKDGTVTCLANGSAVISVICENVTYTCKIVISAYLRGDVNEDGMISPEDATMVLQAYTMLLLDKQPNLTASQILAADADKNGSISETDATLILRYYATAMMDKEPSWEELLQ